MRKEILATLLISIYWIVAGFAVAYSTWRGVMRGLYPDIYQASLPDPYSLGLVLAAFGIVFSFVIIRTMLPSRATQRKKLMRLLDEVGIEDVEAIQRKLNTLSEDYVTDSAASLESLLHEQKRKNQA